jgi:hypothetical protein
MQLRGVAQHRNFGIRGILVAQADSKVYNLLKVGMQSRLTVARKCYHIRKSAISSHLLQTTLQRSLDNLRMIKPLLATIVVIPATLAIDAIKSASLECSGNRFTPNETPSLRE